MVRIRRFCLSLLLTACGDDVAGTAGESAGPSATSTTGDSTGLSASQTSAPEPSTGVLPTTGEPVDTTGEPGTGTATTDEPDTTTGEPVLCTKLEFEDGGLEIQIKEALDIKGEIPLEVALVTEELRLFADWQIDGLGGLECFVNLRVFESDSAGVINDLTPLSHLKKLERLVLPHTWVVDLSPLAGLPALTSLHIRTGKTFDLSPLADLPALVDLTVGDNPLTDFTTLAGHLTLTRLTAYELPGIDLTGLAQIPHLEYLSLDQDELTDLGPLKGAPVLAELQVADNQISDLAPLAGITTLVELHAPGNLISDLAPLTGLAKLEILDLANNHVTDPALLGKLLVLRELNLSDNPLSEGILSLAGLTKLERLYVTRTGITELPAIAPTTLLGLAADDNKIIDLTPLANHAVLENLNLAKNAIVSVDPIVAAPFWVGPCVHADFTENPLDAESVDVDLPALCEGGDAIQFADQFCADCIPMPLSQALPLAGR